jgi:hypothetical protein
MLPMSTEEKPYTVAMCQSQNSIHNIKSFLTITNLCNQYWWHWQTPLFIELVGEESGMLELCQRQTDQSMIHSLSFHDL